MLSDGSGRFVRLSRPLPAPPIYDPGGRVAVADLVAGGSPVGEDAGGRRAALLDSALATAAARGDVLVCVVCAPGDAELAAILAARSFTPTVSVLAWPA